jgi:hypothetical protein
VKKLRRDDHCPCGSGKKYKRCHLTVPSKNVHELLGAAPLEVSSRKGTPGRFVVNENAIKDALAGGHFSPNLRFNRIEGESDNYYHGEFGSDRRLERSYEGYIKVKLGHGIGKSVLVPDLVLLSGNSGLQWIQPFNFLPNMIAFFSKTEGRCTINIDIASAQSIQVEFENSGFVRSFDDGSELFRCTIKGSKELETVTTGRAELTKENRIILELYHHTIEDSAKKISEGRNFRLSPWNIQGTKKLSKIGYVYVTSLPEIQKNGDLRQIAMSHEGKIELVRDGFTPPQVVLGNSLAEAFPDDIVELVVYRDSTSNRVSAIKLGVPAEILAPQHLHLHKMPGDFPYYSVCCPFIHRIGLDIGQTLQFSSNNSVEDHSNLRRFTHVVVGDCTTKDGLQAPYDEETTAQVFKIEFVGAGSNVLRFWAEQRNKDLFSGKTLDPFEFQK